MKIYVAGAGGMLGQAIFSVFSEAHELKCTDIDVNSNWLTLCDFRDLAAYHHSVASFCPDILFHLGAHTDLEYCEKHPADAYSTNTLSVGYATAVAQQHGIPLVYISTAGIFDGSKRLYDDWDMPHPLGVYGRSKYLGEITVQNNVARHFICRAGWMMGGGPTKDKKFIGKLMRQLAGGATALKIVDDKFGTPTYTIDFARNLAALIQTENYGLYNMVCGGETGRLEVAQELVRLLHLENRVSIVPVDSYYFSQEYFAPRPPSESLVNAKLEALGLNLMRDWRVALKEYLTDSYQRYLAPIALSSRAPALPTYASN